jgi:hypothetical protein
MRLASLLFLSLIPPCTASLHAQRIEPGVLVGHSFVVGGDSRTLVEAGPGVLTGGDQAGLHARIFVDLPIATTRLSLRLDAFYNRLTTSVPTLAWVDGQFAPTARVDRTLGLTGSFLATTSRSAPVAVYGGLGAGFFLSHLEGDVTASTADAAAAVTDGMGLGLVAGGGAILRLWSGPRVVVDWRYHQALNNTRGSGFTPLSVGLRF